MKTCPNCGAENLQTAANCRLCALSLESPEDLLMVRAEMPLSETLPPTIVASGEEPPAQHAPASEYGGHQICPVCQAVNHPDHRFCDRCGSKLIPAANPAHAAPPPAQEAPPSPLEMGLATGIVCDSCGAVQPQNATTCSACGAQLSPTSLARIKERAGIGRGPVLRLIIENGEVGESYPIKNGEIRIGRVEGDLVFGHDSFMSSRHARIVERDGRYFLVDENSRNGTFVRIRDKVTLEPGDRFLTGKQIFEFEKQ